MGAERPPHQPKQPAPTGAPPTQPQSPTGALPNPAAVRNPKMGGGAGGGEAHGIGISPARGGNVGQTRIWKLAGYLGKDACSSYPPMDMVEFTAVARARGENPPFEGEVELSASVMIGWYVEPFSGV